MNDTQTLIRGLQDPDRDIRMQTAMALGSTREAGVAEALVARLGADQDATVRETLTWACVQHADEVLPLVVELLHDESADTRRQAAHVLSKIADPSIAGQLSGVIADDDPQVAIKAYRAAASTNDPAVVPALAARLGQGDQELRDALASAFSNLGGHGVETLVRALADTDAEVRAHAAQALGEVGSPAADRAVEALTRATGDEDAAVRVAAVSALAGFEPEVAAPALRSASGSDDRLVSAIATRLLG